MNPEKMKEFIMYLADLLKGLEIELAAYRTVYKALQLSGEFRDELDAGLIEARIVATQEMDAKYARTLEPVFRQLAEATAGQDALLTFLQEWKPNGRIH